MTNGGSGVAAGDRDEDWHADSATGQLAAPELLLYLFASAEESGTETGYTNLRDVWKRLDRLDICLPISRLGVRADLPDSPGDLVGTGVLAARRAATAGVFEALVRRDHDLWTLAILLAPESSSFAWADLDQIGSDLLGDRVDSLVGTARIYCGYRSSPVGASSLDAAPSLDALVRAIGPSVPVPSARTVSACLGVRTGTGFAVWEAGSSLDDERSERRIAVVCPVASANSLSDWLWARPDGAAPWLMDYLADTAKIRYMLRVWGGGSLLRSLRTAADARLAALDQDRGGSTGTAADRRRTEELIRGMRLDRRAAKFTMSRIAEMKQSVDVAAGNMRTSLEEDQVELRPGDLFDDDRALADNLLAQLSDDISYAEALNTRIEAGIAFAGAFVSRTVGQPTGGAAEAAGTADGCLASAARKQLRDLLASLFGRPAAAALLTADAGLDPARQPSWEGRTPREWWDDVVSMFGSGAVSGGLRPLVGAALQEYPYHERLRQFACQVGVGEA